MEKLGSFMGKSFDWWVRNGFWIASRPDLAFRRLAYNVQRAIADRASAYGHYQYPYHILFIAGMPMSASTWVKNLLARIPGYYTRHTPMPKEVAYNQNICDSAFSYHPIDGYTIYKTHLNPTNENLECIFNNGVKKVVITYRDLRDVAIARYHRLVQFPKASDAEDFVDYRALGKEKAVTHSIEIVAEAYIQWIRGWLEIARQTPERYHFTKFESLKKDTKGEFLKILNFYGIELRDKKIQRIVESAKGRKKIEKNWSAAKILPWGYASNFRSGKVGSWREEMTDAQIQKCKELLGQALIELCYEKDSNW
jgi:hypothetical protein